MSSELQSLEIGLQPEVFRRNKTKKDHINDVNLPRIRTLDFLVASIKNSIWGELGVQLEALGQTSPAKDEKPTKQEDSGGKINQNEVVISKKLPPEIKPRDNSSTEEKLDVSNLSENISVTGFQTDDRTGQERTLSPTLKPTTIVVKTSVIPVIVINQIKIDHAPQFVCPRCPPCFQFNLRRGFKLVLSSLQCCPIRQCYSGSLSANQIKAFF